MLQTPIQGENRGLNGSANSQIYPCPLAKKLLLNKVCKKSSINFAKFSWKNATFFDASKRIFTHPDARKILHPRIGPCMQDWAPGAH